MEARACLREEVLEWLWERDVSEVLGRRADPRGKSRQGLGYTVATIALQRSLTTYEDVISSTRNCILWRVTNHTASVDGVEIFDSKEQLL